MACSTPVHREPYLHGRPELMSIVLGGSHQQSDDHLLKVATQLTLQLPDQILQDVTVKQFKQLVKASTQTVRHDLCTVTELL